MSGKNTARLGKEQSNKSTKDILREFLSKEVVKALLALVLILLLGLIFNADGAFFKFATHRDTLRSMAVYGILACGMTLVIISGGIDLAVGSVLALVAVFHFHYSLGLVTLACYSSQLGDWCAYGFDLRQFNRLRKIATVHCHSCYVHLCARCRQIYFRRKENFHLHANGYWWICYKRTAKDLFPD